MPILTKPKWCSGKAATLQIEILNEIATEGQLSKTMAKELTRSHYPDVSDAIDGLSKRHFIEPPTTFFLHPKSRQRRFFQLTHDGLQAFIDGKPSPADFWKAIYWFCKLSESKIDWNTFDALYRRFQNIYLGYTPHHWHFFQFRFIDILFKKWLKDNDKIYDPVRDNDVRRVVLSQCILECLGMNRAVTLGQLSRHIKEQTFVLEGEVTKAARDIWSLLGFGGIDSSEEGIRRALEEFTLSEKYESPDYSPRPDLRYELDQILDRYVDFIQHLVVVSCIDEKGETRYELSLFGIALLLSVRACEFWNPERVFYNNLDFGGFCAKLSANYSDKLPLVFGKWDSLIRETQGYHYNIIIEILRDLFYGHTSSAMMESSVVLGGVREYYESAKDLSGWSYPKLEEIHQAGEDFLEELVQPDCNELLSRKVDEISNSLSQRNLHKFMGGSQANLEYNSLTRDPHDIYAKEFVNMEKALADEITFLFYIFFSVRGSNNFNRERFEPVYSTYFPALFRDLIWIGHKFVSSFIGDTYPHESFVNIIRKHEDIKQMLVSWIDDTSKCQNDVEEKISRLKSYTQKE